MTADERHALGELADGIRWPCILEDLAAGRLDNAEAAAVVAWLRASTDIEPPAWMIDRAVELARRAADRRHARPTAWQRIWAALAGWTLAALRPHRAASAGAPVPAAGSAEPDGSPAPILVVEDDPAEARLIELVLGPERPLLLAQTGQAALELARRTRPAVITLDLRLPDISGQVVLATLKADPRTASVPVVVVSAYDRGFGSEGLLTVGQVIGKPFEPGELREAVRRAQGAAA